MLPQFRFAAPELLWLLLVPGFLFMVWLAAYIQRRRDIRRRKNAVITPFKEKFRIAGRSLAGTLFLLIALTPLIGALAKPQFKMVLRAKFGVSLIVVGDDSPSMTIEDIRRRRCPSRVQQVIKTRRQEALCFMRTLAHNMRWERDRMGIALFADQGVPLAHLTRDPNVILYFLEQIADSSQFRVDNTMSWNTNMEEGLFWTRRMLEMFDELIEERGEKDGNIRAVVLISDGGVLDGNVEREVGRFKEAGIPLYVVGTGTDKGGIIPSSEKYIGERVHWSIERDELEKIASLGSGRYFELGTRSDRDITYAILSDIAVRRNALRRTQGRAGRVVKSEEVPEHQDVYWYFLLAAAIPLAFAGWSLR